MSKLLFVDDDPELCEHAEDWFVTGRETVEFVRTGREALERLELFSYDIVLLDLGLPDTDGISLIKYYRSQGGHTPILVLTGQAEIQRKELALDSGADDYLTKPFHLRELSARIRALLRRPHVMTGHVLSVGDLEINTMTKHVSRGGREIVLLPREYALLEFFVSQKEQFFSSEVLLERLWECQSETSPDAIRVYINRLRNKIDLPGLPRLLQTQRGFGYRISGESMKAWTKMGGSAAVRSASV